MSYDIWTDVSDTERELQAALARIEDIVKVVDVWRTLARDRYRNMQELTTRAEAAEAKVQELAAALRILIHEAEQYQDEPMSAGSYKIAREALVGDIK